MKKFKSLLTQFGLSDAAEQIYLTLLAKETCSIAELARLTGKHRPAIYKAIPELLDLDLVTRVNKKKRVIYRPESPHILSLLSKKQTDNFNTALQKLLDIFRQKDEKPKITFFEGREGIMTAYEKLISSAKNREAFYRYESPRDYKKNKKYYPPLYWKRAGTAGDIDKYVITNQKTNQNRHANLNRFSKSIPVPFEENITEIMSSDKVVFIDYDTETSIFIENQRFADFQKSIFKMLFEKLNYNDA